MSVFVHRLALGGAGPRVAIKDVIDIAGLPTVCGSRAREHATPAKHHAAVVERLLAAGCRIIGKVTLHELAFGVTGINPWAGTPVNPLDRGRIPGGSSSGSAVAVAAGEADIAIGTDTGGSIRVPAACCGVFGLKPSFGRISRQGILPAISSLDCVGPLARDMAGIIHAMACLEPGFAPARAGAPRIGRLDLEANPVILAAIDTALDLSGLAVVPMSLPSMGNAFDAALAIINNETYAAFGDLLATGLLNDDVAKRLAAAARTTTAAVLQAEAIRIQFREEVDALLQKVDVLALPTLPDFPPRLEDAWNDRSGVALTAFVRPFNLSGHPALTIPVPTTAGFPTGLQLVGRAGEDALLCALGERLHAAAAGTNPAPGVPLHV